MDNRQIAVATQLMTSILSTQQQQLANQNVLNSLMSDLNEIVSTSDDIKDLQAYVQTLTDLVSTSANQDITNSYLDSIDDKITPIGITSTVNSTTTLLNAGNTFTGVSELNEYPDSLIVCRTDQNGTLFADFSVDGTNWDSSLSFSISANTPEIHKFSKAGRYFRVRFTNTSANNQTFLRLSTYYGIFNQITSSLNSVIQLDADASVVRSVDAEGLISQGLLQGYSIVNKFGRNPDVDAVTVPEDIWDGGALYAGFPTGAPEEFEVFSSNAGDTGVLTFTYLASNTSTDWQTATVTLTGTTPVNTGITGYRMHTASYSSGSATAFNLGNITIRHRVTTANVFCVMIIGTSQTYASAYTVPSGSIGYVKRLFCNVFSNTVGQVEGALYVRALNGSPRLRRPFSASNNDAFQEEPYGGIMIPSGSDIIVRIPATTATNLDVIAGYDLVLIKN